MRDREYKTYVSKMYSIMNELDSDLDLGTPTTI